MRNDMQRFIKIVETAEFDYARRDPTKTTKYASDTFSKRGAAYRIKRNDPRFGDNPLEDDAAVVREDVTSPQLIRLHSELNKVVSDEEIKAGLSLAQSGLHKLAGMLGIGPQDVQVLLSSLTQNLRDDDAAMEEDYHAYLEAAADEQPPFADDPEDDDLSIEQDALGSGTVRSAASGKSKFVQGTVAADLEKKLASPGADRQTVLRTMMAEEATFDAEIQADTGSYNFPWKLAGQHGFATAFFRRDSAKPELKITGISDAEGNDIDLPQAQRHALTQQALDFIGDA
jgi:hypothetical protein